MLVSFVAGLCQVACASKSSLPRGRSQLQDQFYACQMPPPTKRQPTPAERDKLLAWLEWVAPDN